MIPLGPVPFRTPISGQSFLPDAWAKYFRDVSALLGFDNNHSRAPAPTFTGITVVGTVARDMVYIKDRNLIHLQLIFTPSGGGTLALTAGTSYLSNLPYSPSHAAVGVLVNLSTLAVVGGVHAAAGTTRLNLPTLAASSAAHAATLTFRTEDA